MENKLHNYDSLLMALLESGNLHDMDKVGILSHINKVFALDHGNKTSYKVTPSQELAVVRGEDDETPLTNTVIVPVCEKIIHSLDGNRRVLQVIGLRDGTFLGGFLISPSEMNSITTRIREEWGFKSRIYLEQNAHQYIMDSINVLCKSVPVFDEFNYIGWSKSNPGLYISGSGAIGSNVPESLSVHKDLKGYSLATCEVSEEKSFRFIINTILKIAPAEITHTAVAFLLVSILTSKFSESPYKPDFVYFMHGESGGRKTSMGKIFWNIHEKFLDSVPINFTATQPAIEKMLTLMRDAVCLIDDIAPSTNPAEKQAIEKKLEGIIRSQGDSIGRQKMRSFHNKVEMRPEGLVAITAEDNIIKSSSSLARCFMVKSNKDDVNLEKLSEAQENRRYYPTAIKFYLEHISMKGESFMEIFRKDFNNHREYFSEKIPEAHGRLIMTASWLHTAFSTFLKYGEQRGFLEKSKQSQLIKENLSLLRKKIKEQDMLVKHDNDSDMYVKAMKEMLITKKVRIAEIRLTGKKKVATGDLSQDAVLGFSDVDNIYLLPETSYSAVLSFYSKQRIVFPVSLKSLLDGLYRKGLLKPDNNKDGTKTVRLTVNQQRVNVIRIDRDKFEAWGEDPYHIDLTEYPGSLAGPLISLPI